MAALKVFAGNHRLSIFLIVMLVGLAVCMFLGYFVLLLVELTSFLSSLIGVGYG